MKFRSANWLRKLPYLFGLVVIVFSLGLGMSGLFTARAQEAGPQGQAALITDNSGSIQDYAPINEIDGWVLLNDHLYWTGDNGGTWKDITPNFSPGVSIQDVVFQDKDTGWIFSSTPDSSGNIEFQVARTTDAGLDWDLATLQILPANDLDAVVDAAAMFWLDDTTGWISIKRSTGQNFSIGRLFRTNDGGKTWIHLSLPLGEEVYFADALHGWVAGGPAGDQLFRTQDGGASWDKLALPGIVFDSLFDVQYFPLNNSAENGILLVASTHNNVNIIELFSTSDAGDHWKRESSILPDTSPGDFPVSFFGSQNLMIVVPNSAQIIRMGNGGSEVATNQDGASAAIVGLEMLSSTYGWAKWISSTCSLQTTVGPDQSSAVSCTSVNKLIRTGNGGLTWEELALPETGSTFLAKSSISNFGAQTDVTNQGNTQAFVGQGFDKCEIPSAAQLQTWWNGSPYRVVNLYIGGSLRACSNTSLSSSYLDQLSKQGWKFIPTWVGPQAPCSSFRLRFSASPAEAYNQGVSEAISALNTLASLGLTLSDGTGSIVYYDLEGYTADTSCTNAVKSFMNGWVGQIHSRLSLAGVYGGACASGINNFLSIPNIPDAVWLAAWKHAGGSGYYDPNATVWDVACMSNSNWANHQRILQYEGGHAETWGNLTMTIDNDVLDGVVAIYTSATSCPQSAGVILYWNADYNCSNSDGDAGYRQRTSTGFQNVDDGSFNDKASSIKVPAGWSVMLYEHTNLWGGKVCVNSDMSDFGTLGNFPGTTVSINDNISSMEVFSYNSCTYQIFMPLVNR
jgi:photosystem II stability/assembly factor-like uncharacterized protein